jgi:hypothetical protein
MKMTKKEQQTMLKVKSLLNQLSYIIKDEHITICDDYHRLCRKYCSWGK